MDNLFVVTALPVVSSRAEIEVAATDGASVICGKITDSRLNTCELLTFDVYTEQQVDSAKVCPRPTQPFILSG